MTKQTEQYAFAERVTRAKVVVEVYDDSSMALDGAVVERQVVRARLDKDGAEYGCETLISSWTELTIGQSLDLALTELMKGRPEGSKPNERHMADAMLEARKG